MNYKYTRNSGIELLRIFALLGVIMIHFSDRAFPVLLESGNGLYLLMFIRSLCASSVDVFLIITGYFMCDKFKRSLGKPFSLVLQVCVYSELIYLVMCMFSVYPITLKHFFGQLIPDSYYTTLFVVLYFISPYINLVLSRLSECEIKKFLLILIFIFSFMSVLPLVFEEVTDREYMGLNTIGAWGSSQGFNIVNFCLCYIVGATIRRVKLPACFERSFFLCSMIIITVCVIFLWSIGCYFLLFPNGMCSAWVYDNPLVILLGSLCFILFKNIHLNSNFVDAIAKCVYATFIIHCGLIWHFPIERICDMPWYILYISFVLFSICSILLSWLIFRLYSLFTTKLLRKLDTILIVNLSGNSDNIDRNII